jgi:Pentapeptide repeats (8 copies)
VKLETLKTSRLNRSLLFHANVSHYFDPLFTKEEFDGMIPSKPISLTNQNLRNLSFKGRNLQGVNFSGSDLRGCDLSYAHLQEANFEKIKAGHEPRKLLELTAIALFVGFIAFRAYTQISFNSIEFDFDPRCIGLAIASLGVAIAQRTRIKPIASIARQKSLIETIAMTVSGSASGALMGYYYIGHLHLTQKIPHLASFGAVIGAIAVASLFFSQKKDATIVAIAASGALAACHLTFLLAVKTSVALGTKSLVSGSFWGVLSLISLVVVIFSFDFAICQIGLLCCTSFQGANLTKAKFSGACLGNSNFRNAIGFRR